LSFTDLAAEKRNAVCLKCHSPKVTAAIWQTSAHAKLGFSCTNCHEMHTPAQAKFMLRKNIGEDCYACHSGMRDLAAEGKHHKLPEGLDCRRCHSPHGSNEPHGLLKPKSELCKTCHGAGAAGMPEGHGSADWKKTHGKTAKTDLSACTGCHDKEKFCSACHGTEMPHPEGWVMGHKDKGATFDPKGICLKCHERSFCRCHGTG